MKKPFSFSIEEALGREFNTAFTSAVDGSLSKSEVVAALLEAYVNNQLTVARVTGADAPPRVIWLGEIDPALLRTEPTPTPTPSITPEPEPKVGANLLNDLSRTVDEQKLVIAQTTREKEQFEAELQRVIATNTELEAQLAASRQQVGLLREQVNQASVTDWVVDATTQTTPPTPLDLLNNSALQLTKTYSELVLSLIEAHDRDELGNGANLNKNEAGINKPADVIQLPLEARCEEEEEEDSNKSWNVTTSFELPILDNLPITTAFTLAKSCMSVLDYFAVIYPRPEVIKARAQAEELLKQAYNGRYETPADAPGFEEVVAQVSAITEQLILA